MQHSSAKTTPTKHAVCYEPLFGFIRIFSDADETNPRPNAASEWSAGLRWIDGKDAELIGADKSPTFSQCRSLVRRLRELGVRNLLVRRADGSSRVHRVTL